MPTQFTFEDIPAGVTLTGALPDENLLVSTKAYLSSEDGNDFISHVEAVWGYFAPALRPLKLHPSQIDHFLAVIDRNKTATVYCNELQQRALVQAKRPVEAGQNVFRDDIANIEELVFHNSSGTQIDIPPDSGLVLILSAGWRKCLYYDFEALLPETPPRSLNMPRLFGGIPPTASLPRYVFHYRRAMGWYARMGMVSFHLDDARGSQQDHSVFSEGR